MHHNTHLIIIVILLLLQNLNLWDKIDYLDLNAKHRNEMFVYAQTIVVSEITYSHQSNYIFTAKKHFYKCLNSMKVINFYEKLKITIPFIYIEDTNKTLPFNSCVHAC